MNSNITIHRATHQNAQHIAIMVGELLDEIMQAIGNQAFNFSLSATSDRLADFIEQEKYYVFIAQDENAAPVGFITLCVSYALYAEGAFGIIPELFVRPAYRSQKVGLQLMEQAKTFGRLRGWKRLEVTTPQLPQFNKTLAFYEREGFAIAGGRKMKVLL